MVHPAFFLLIDTLDNLILDPDEIHAAGLSTNLGKGTARKAPARYDFVSTSLHRGAQ